MKFEINEVFFLKNAAEATNIKASDAHTVSALLTKLDKEFVRLQKLEEKKQQQQEA